MKHGITIRTASMEMVTLSHPFLVGCPCLLVHKQTITLGGKSVEVARWRGKKSKEGEKSGA